MSFLTPFRGNSAIRDLLYGFMASAGHQIRPISTSFPVGIQVSPCLMGEPLRKKKKIDVQVLKLRHERKVKRIEKAIRALQKFKKIPKPIEENQIPVCLRENAGARKRVIDIPENVVDERILLVKTWSRMRTMQAEMEKKTIARLIAAQDKALKELRNESEELYQAAVEFDEKLIPFQFKGPVETPPIEGYDFPDGDYIDISKDWSKEQV